MLHSSRTGDSGRAILRSLLARLRDERQAPAVLKELQEVECRLFLREYETFHAELRERDPKALVEMERERREFDVTLTDGLRD
jgi:hypothetical protein